MGRGGERPFSCLQVHVDDFGGQGPAVIAHARAAHGAKSEFVPDLFEADIHGGVDRPDTRVAGHAGNQAIEGHVECPLVGFLSPQGRGQQRAGKCEGELEVVSHGLFGGSLVYDPCGLLGW